MPRPYPIDITTHETNKTGSMTIFADTFGDSDDLRDVLELLCDTRPDLFYARGNIRTNVPQPPPQGD